MAKKSSVEKQKKKEILVERKKEQRAQLKLVIRSLETSEEDRLEAINKLNKLPANSSKVRLRNRCQLTGRPRGYLRKFKVSRLCFREMSNAGLIPGVMKASW